MGGLEKSGPLGTPGDAWDVPVWLFTPEDIWGLDRLRTPGTPEGAREILRTLGGRGDVLGTPGDAGRLGEAWDA